MLSSRSIGLLAAVATLGGSIACSGTPASVNAQTPVQELLQSKFAGNAFAVLHLDERQPGCAADPTEFNPTQLTPDGFAACAGVDASKLAAGLSITTDPLQFDPAGGVRSVLAILATAPPGSDAHLWWYAVVGLGPASAIADDDVASTAAFDTSPQLRPRAAAALLGGAEAVEALGLTIPGADLVFGALLAGTVIYEVTQSGSRPSPAVLDGVGDAASSAAGVSLLADSGQCNTDQECCLEDGTASPSDPVGPSQDGSQLPKLNMGKFFLTNGYGQMSAIQGGVRALNTATGQVETLNYVVSGNLFLSGDTLTLAKVLVAPMFDETAPLDYVYRPGAAAMRSMLDGVAREMAARCPTATKLIVKRSRDTADYGKLRDGTQRDTCATMTYDLTRLR